MKNGWIFLETLIAIAVFALISTPMLFLLQENNRANKLTFENQISGTVFTSLLEDFYSGGLPETEIDLRNFGIHIISRQRENTQYIFELKAVENHESEATKVLVTMNWQDARGNNYVRKIEIFTQLK